MTSSSLLARVSPEARAAIYHFTVFGPMGVASVYFGIWLANRGIRPEEVGIINAAPVLLMLVANVFIGRLADRARDWRSAIIVLSLFSGFVAFGLFFVSGFWGIILVWTLTMMPAAALVPITDAATLRMTQRRGTDFGIVRAWGTVGFMAMAIAAGPLIGWLGDAAFAPLFVAVAALRAVLSLQLPAFRGDRSSEAPAPAGPAVGKLREVMKPWFIATLIGLGIVYSTHAAIGAFAALLWVEQGISEALIGPLIAVMAASEAVMMFLWSRFKVKVSARHLILIAALVAAFRWGVMAFSPPIWVLFPLQLLHSITFAVGYFGGIYFIANWTREEIAAEAQGFSYVLQQAMSVIVLVGMGWCVQAFGAGAWLVLSGYALLGAVCVLVSLRLWRPLAASKPPPVTSAPADV